MGESTPICRCRVLYLGSAVPRQSKDGLQGIQEPLRSLYPSEGAVGAKGIDSWLSVWSNGILLENVDENRKQVTRFFPIESLHYCAAVRQVLIPERGNTNPEPKFLPLDSPFARMPKAQHPPIFAAILRRTTGIKVLECHVFICKREAAANALVRCCFHAYADNSYARQLEGSNSGGVGVGGIGSSGSVYGTLGGGSATNGSLTEIRAGGVGGGYVIGNASSKSNCDLTTAGLGPSNGNGWRSRAGSTTTLNSVGRHSSGGHFMNGNSSASLGMNGGLSTGSNGSGAEGYTSVKNFYGSSADLDVIDDCEGSIYNGDENHKVWNGSQDQLDGIAGTSSVALESPYEMFSSGGASTLGRPARARQISAPIPVPPPPMKEESRKKKDKKSPKSGSQSLSGTLIRPKPIHANSLQRTSVVSAAGLHHHHHHHHHPPPPGSIIYAPINPPSTPQLSRQYHTFSHRAYLANGNGSGGPPSPHHFHSALHGPPPPLPPHPAAMHGAVPGPVGPSPHHLHPHSAAMGMPMQMPIMLPTQYATLQSGRSSKKKKKDKMNGIPVAMPMPPPMFYQQGHHHHHHPVPSPSIIPEPRPLAMSNRKLAQSAGAGLDDSGNSGAESPGGTGIYRRKGHLNERAFSYSIRQEHRSRSHGSLASLHFNPPDIKKEREIAQMVAGLDLNDDGQHSQTTTMHRRTSAINSGGYGPQGNFGKPRR